ncbi:hypothetical protein L915_12191, partial [Phytophthora nicotianae]
MNRMFGSTMRTTDWRGGEGAVPYNTRRSVEEDSWTEVERKELDQLAH